jgi:hypothetical protein
MWWIGVYKRIPEEWLKKQSPRKQYDVLKFSQRLKFWKHDNKPYMDGGFLGPTRHDKAKQVKLTLYVFHMIFWTLYICLYSLDNSPL